MLTYVGGRFLMNHRVEDNGRLARLKKSTEAARQNLAMKI